MNELIIKRICVIVSTLQYIYRHLIEKSPNKNDVYCHFGSTHRELFLSNTESKL
jgi:hypothetical protein